MTDTVSLGPPGNLRFGVFELDFAQGELRREGVKVRLQDQPLRLLQLLLERPGEIVTREELREKLWPKEFVDFDHGLNTAVRKLRAALDDTAESPRYIETLARRGYRFIAPVATSAEAVPATTATPRGTRGATLVAAAIVVIVLVTAAIFWIRQRGRTAAFNAISAVAVLPFTNNDPASEHVSDGLSEILIDTLSLTPELRVTARTSVFRYKGEDIDPSRIGRELNVGALVMGDVRRDRDRVTIRVDLIDVRDATQIWGRRFDAKLTDLVAVQSRISEELSRTLRQRISDERQRLIGRAYTRDPQAYDLYLRGLYAWNRRSRDDLQESVNLFRQAIDRDPSFAAAHAGLANSYGVMISNGILTPDRGVAMVLAAARKTLELDPANAEAYTSIASTQYRNLWDFPAAERNYRRSLELNPNYATGHQWFADYLRSMGRLDEARREIDIAYSLDPLSPPINGSKCWSLYVERKYREAIAFSQKVANADPRLRSGFCEGAALAALGEYDALIRQLEENGGPDAAKVVAAYRSGGQRGFYAKRVEFMLARQAQGFSTPVEIADAYARLGDYEKAFQWLEKAYVERASRITSINTNPAFDGMSDDPRFKDLLRRIGLPEVKF